MQTKYLGFRVGSTLTTLDQTTRDKCGFVWHVAGWSSSILSLDMDFMDEKNGRYSVGASAICRVTLRDGAYHEDVGYGQSDNMKDKAKALEKAKKSGSVIPFFISAI